MREILLTTDIVLISFASSLLAEANLTFHVADTHISVIEGSIDIFPHRLLVLDRDETQARQLLHDAGLDAELSRPMGREPTAPTPDSQAKPKPA